MFPHTFFYVRLRNGGSKDGVTKCPKGKKWDPHIGICIGQAKMPGPVDQKVPDSDDDYNLRDRLLACEKSISDWMAADIRECQERVSNWMKDDYWSTEGTQNRYRAPVNAAKEDLHALGARLQRLKTYIAEISEGQKSAAKRTGRKSQKKHSFHGMAA